MSHPISFRQTVEFIKSYPKLLFTGALLATALVIYNMKLHRLLQNLFKKKEQDNRQPPILENTSKNLDLARKSKNIINLQRNYQVRLIWGNGANPPLNVVDTNDMVNRFNQIAKDAMTDQERSFSLKVKGSLLEDYQDDQGEDSIIHKFLMAIQQQGHVKEVVVQQPGELYIIHV